MLEGMARLALEVIQQAGYLGLGFLVAVENLIPPIPSEVILPLAGYLTSQGSLSLPLAIFAATVGSVIGAHALYYLGHRLGENRLRRFIERRGKWFLISVSDFDKSSSWFSRHGNMAVLIGRCVPGVRSFISIPAGIKHMPVWQFTLYTALGSLIWNALLIGLGWWLGARWQRVGHFINQFETAIWMIVGALLIFWIRRKIQQYRRQTS